MSINTAFRLPDQLQPSDTTAVRDLQTPVATATDVDIQEAFNEARDAQREYIRARDHMRARVARLRTLQQEAVEHEQVAA